MEVVVSPYLGDLESFDYSPNQSQYDSFEFGGQGSSFSHTPSYNGSYQNSPYSAPSELSFDPSDLSAGAHSAHLSSRGLFDSEVGITIEEPDNRYDYDPNDYDAPNSGGLLMFNSDFMNTLADSEVSVAVTPPMDENSPHSFDNPSPGSSYGEDSRSRASSVSQRQSPLPNFNRLSFDQHSPPQKPQSPPQLLIPDDGSNMPTINAPEGTGGSRGGLGPQLHVEPATPVGGPANYVTQDAWQPDASQPFQQHAYDTAPSSRVNTATSQTSFTFPAQPSQFNPNTAPSSLGLNTPNVSSNMNNTNNYLIPSSPRGRSKSDTSSLRPDFIFPPPSHNNYHDQSALELDDSGLNMNNMSPQQSPPYPHPPHLTHNFTFGPPSSSSGGNGFLSPDLLAGTGPLRRAKSDGSNRQGHTRMARSDDFGRGRGSASLLSTPTLGGQSLPYPPSSHQDFIRHAHSQSQGSTSSQFLHPSHAGSLGQPLSSALDGGMGMGPARGHHRRASSGSRSAHSRSPYPTPSPRSSPRMLPNNGLYPGEYEYDDGSVGVVSGFAKGMMRGPGVPLLDDEQFDFGTGGMNGMNLVGGQGLPLLPAGGQGQQGQQGPVQKQNVTTHATKDASERRRKTDAAFVCPVAGCGSTFTRSFNLKGHLRSHTDDRPFKCKWPGCSKSFARQHDCKRHEQLHLGVREFKCGGCGKEFARMDALNRHLRSEGGAECQKAHQEFQEEKHRAKLANNMNTPDPSSHLGGEIDATMPFPKSEPGEGNWPNGTNGIIM